MAVIRMGRRRVRPASITASRRRKPLADAHIVGEADHQDGVGHRNAHRHDRAHQGFHIDGGPGHRQHPENADQRAGHRHHDDQRVEPGLEQDHQQGIDQDHRQDQAFAQVGEGRVHHLILAADGDGGGGRQAGLDLVDGFLDVGRDGAQIAAVDIGVDIDHPLNRVMVDGLHVGGGRDSGNVGQAQGRRAWRGGHGWRRPRARPSACSSVGRRWRPAAAASAPPQSNSRH